MFNINKKSKFVRTVLCSINAIVWSFIATSTTITSCTLTKIYSVHFNSNGNILTKDGQAFLGQDFTTFIKPKQGYEITNVTVKCSNHEIENIFEEGSLFVSKDFITGDLTIDVETNIKTCKVNIDNENVAYKFIGNNEVIAFQNYEAEIIANNGYEITNVIAKCNDKEIGNFDNKTNKLTINKDVIIDDLTIFVETKQKRKYTINVNGNEEEFKFKGDLETFATQDYKAIVTAVDGCEITNVIAKCNDKEIGNFDNKTNKLTINKDVIIDDLTIIVETKQKRKYTINVNGNKEEFKFKGDLETFATQDYKAIVTAVDGCEITSVIAKCNDKVVGTYNQETNTLVVNKQDIKGNLNISVNTKIKMFEINGKDNVKFKYSDSFFKNPSTEFNPSLATASYGIINSATTCLHGDLSINGDQYIKNLMVDKLKLDNYEQIGYNTPTTPTSIGLSIATKELKFGDSSGNKKTKLILLPIRSGDYGLEWCDNMFIGADVEYRKIISDFDSNEYEFKSKYANHAGFCLSAQIAIHALKQYIEKYNLCDENIVLWIIGYSRGGAIANTMAGLLDRAISENNLNEYFGKDTNLKLSKNNIYTYTIAAPQAANSNQEPKPYSETYNNIFNLINPNDLIPCLPPKQWGFTRYGIAKYMSTRTIDPNYDQLKQLQKKYLGEKAKLIDDIDNFTPYTIGGDKNLDEFKNVTPQVAWESLMAALVENIPTREDYRYGYQEKIKEILYGVMAEGKKINDYITSLISLFPKDCKIINWLSTIIHSGIVLDIHSNNTYFCYAKGLDPLYTSEDQRLYTLDNWKYYWISTRGFDDVTVTDVNTNTTVVHNNYKPSVFCPDLPYSSQVTSCSYDYTGFPYYIDVIVPCGHYRFDYAAIHVWNYWKGYGRVICIASNNEIDGKKIYEQEHNVSIWHSNYSETLYLE